MPRPPRQRPRELVDDWPKPASSRVAEAEWGRVSGKPGDESLVKPARVARQFAVNVRAAIAGRSIREVAETCGLEHSVVVRVLNGDQWPDLVTITKLEDGLGADLWPRRDARG